jgi:uncharacterized protein (DUF433 family)
MRRRKKVLNETEIDDLMIAQADDGSAWSKPFCQREEETDAMLTLDDEQLAQLPVSSDPEVMSGATVFSGTRVPVAALFDNLAAGLTLDEFLDNFPTVTREQALQVLEFVKNTLIHLGRAA